MVKGEAASRRTSSVRLRLMLPIAAAIAGVLVLGTIQVGEALRTDADAGRALILADLANSTAKILHIGQDEVAETTKSHEHNGETFEYSYQSQLDRTDEFVAEFRTDAAKVKKEVPDLDAVLTTADGALDQLGDQDDLKPQTARGLMQNFAKNADVALDDPDVTNGLALYRSIAYRVLDVADALHPHIADPNLAQQARALAALAGAKQAAGDERFLVRNMLSASQADADNDGKDDKIPADAVTDLARFMGVEQQRLGEFYRASSARAKGFYATIVTGPPLVRTNTITNNLLNERAPGFTAQEWDFAQADRIDKLHQVETALSEDLNNSAIALTNQAQRDAWVTGGSVLLVAGLSFFTAMFLALRISRRLRSLREDALSAAEDTLPTAVAEMVEARSEKQVSDAVTAAESVAVTERSGPNDEVGAVSQAFAVVHSQALRLAADQAMLRLDVAAMMIALARRGQSLVQRQLHMLDEFADVERDPEGIDRLRSLNHLASRMRRNEENLLLLAGGDPGRRHNAATSVARAVSEAAGEIEDSHRVVIEDAAESLIQAGVVGDVVHLLAELLENAAVFSPPSTNVRVATRHTVHEVVISINDEGIGLPPEQVRDINEQLAEPSGLTSSTAGTMGLLVVARLAARHGIDVRLHSTAGKGTLAVVRLPEALIAADGAAGPVSVRPGFDGADRRRQSPLSPTSPLALAAEPSEIPVTGDGESIGSGPGTLIVPHQLVPGAAEQPETRPSTAMPPPSAGNGHSAQSGWFMPATGSGDFPSLPPGSLSWQAGSGDVAYDKARQAIAAVEPEPPVAAATGTGGEQGGLPQRRPGARLLPGSIETPDNGTSSRPDDGSFENGIDPDEIRSRLAGFAGGIAAAAESSSSGDSHNAPGDR
jgi:signal transduction histidine kinase